MYSRKDAEVLAGGMLFFPGSNHFADIYRVDAGFKAIVPLLRRVVAEVLFCLMPGGHGLALDN